MTMKLVVEVRAFAIDEDGEETFETPYVLDTAVEFNLETKCHVDRSEDHPDGWWECEVTGIRPADTDVSSWLTAYISEALDDTGGNCKIERQMERHANKVNPANLPRNRRAGWEG